MKKGLLIWIAVGAWLTSSASSVSQAAGPLQAARAVASRASTPSAYRPVVDKYCVSCHNERLKAGNLALDKIDLAKADNAEALEKVVRKLRSGQMPPIGSPRPDQATYDGFATSLEASVSARTAALSPSGGEGTRLPLPH